MSSLAYLCLLLSAFTALVSAKPISSPGKNTVYNNCSGDYTHSVPNDVGTGYYAAQVHVKPEDVFKNGTGWEEWLFMAHNPLPDGSEVIYGYKWVWGDPTSGNFSHKAFIGFAYFSNGTYFRQIDRGTSDYQEHPDGGFTVSVVDNHISWDPKQAQWHISVNSGGFVVDEYIESLSPSIPYEPNYQGKSGQISKGFYSRMDVPRANSKGEMKFPWGLKHTIDSIGTIKHTWANDIMADILTAYVRGSIFLPNKGTVNWYQAWDDSGKEVDSVQFLAHSHGAHDDEEVFRLQVTDDKKLLDIVTTPDPLSPPLSYAGTEITLPLCGPGANAKYDKMTWKATNPFQFDHFIDFAGAPTLYQKVDITAHFWSNGKVVDVTGGFGIVELYHRL